MRKTFYFQQLYALDQVFPATMIGLFGFLLQEILQIPFSIIEDKNGYNMVNKVSFG